jgi:hypothetical protein
MRALQAKKGKLPIASRQVFCDSQNEGDLSLERVRSCCVTFNHSNDDSEFVFDKVIRPIRLVVMLGDSRYSPSKVFSERA